MAFNTPYKLFKRYASHEGGIATAIISWPNGIAAHGEIRDNYVNVSDITPTVYDLWRAVAAPVRRGRKLRSSRPRSARRSRRFALCRRAAFCSAVLYTFSNTLGTDTTTVGLNTANIGSRFPGQQIGGAQEHRGTFIERQCRPVTFGRHGGFDAPRRRRGWRWSGCPAWRRAGAAARRRFARRRHPVRGSRGPQTRPA